MSGNSVSDAMMIDSDDEMQDQPSQSSNQAFASMTLASEPLSEIQKDSDDDILMLE